MPEKENNNRKYVDLHLHSTFSDGSMEVPQIIEKSFKKGLRAISITDHDSIDAYPEACRLGEGIGLEIIPGLELSSESKGLDIHFLGYHIEYNSSLLAEKLNHLKESRYWRAKKMVENLNRMGIDLRFDTVLNIAGTGAIGRPHLAMAMLREELICSFREAFEKFIGYDSPAYVGKEQIEPAEAIELILAAGGIPVLAHPGVTGVEDRLNEFVSYGLAGVEVFHSEHSRSRQNRLRQYCKENNLLMTGGSDFHSSTQTKAEIGLPKVQYRLVEKLNERKMKN